MAVDQQYADILKEFRELQNEHKRVVAERDSLMAVMEAWNTLPPTVPAGALEALVKKWNADAETIYATGGFYVSDLQAIIDQAREKT